jgi:two-component sensor histidine kinase
VPYAGNGEIELPAGQNEVTVRYESIGFQRPLRTQYSWRVKGFHNEWTTWSEDRVAFLSHLPGGHYNFEVRSRHPGSEDSTAYITDSYRFQVSLPFFREPGFYKYAFFGFGLAILIGGLMLWFFLKARREAIAMRKSADKREKLIKYYQVQTLQAQLNPHFIFNLLETIQNFVEQQKRQEAVEQIQRLAKLLRRFLESSINSNLDHIGEGTREITLSSEIELLRYYVELEQIQKPGMFEYEINIEEGLNENTIYISPMIIQPFVENSIKRGLIQKEQTPRNLWIKFERQNEGVRGIVEDNGIGIEASRALQAKSSRMFKPRGVHLVRERAKLLKELGVTIEIETQDRAGGGTIVIIDFANVSG